MMYNGWQPKQTCTGLGIEHFRKHNIVHDQENQIIEMQMHTCTCIYGNWKKQMLVQIHFPSVYTIRCMPCVVGGVYMVISNN